MAQAEQGEKLYMMVGDFVDSPDNPERADHHLMAEGYIAVTPCDIGTTDYTEYGRMAASGIDIDF